MFHLFIGQSFSSPAFSATLKKIIKKLRRKKEKRLKEKKESKMNAKNE